MAQSKKQKQLMNFVYGMGAAVVIIGALFKIQHISLDLGVFQLSGGVMLTIGLVVAQDSMGLISPFQQSWMFRAHAMHSTRRVHPASTSTLKAMGAMRSQWFLMWSFMNMATASTTFIMRAWGAGSTTAQ